MLIDSEQVWNRVRESPARERAIPPEDALAVASTVLDLLDELTVDVMDGL